MRHQWETEGPDNRLFDACFRIQQEACEAAGHYIPLVVENVKGAQQWVGPAKGRYGSFYLWGDVETVNGVLVAGRKMAFGVPTLRNSGRAKVPGQDWNNFKNGLKSEVWNDAAVRQMEEESGRKVNHHLNGEVPAGTGETSWFFGNTKHELRDGVKQGGGWWHDPESMTRRFSSRSAARREASARIAMIPRPLAEYIGRAFLPDSCKIIGDVSQGYGTY